MRPPKAIPLTVLALGAAALLALAALRMSRARESDGPRAHVPSPASLAAGPRPPAEPAAAAPAPGRSAVEARAGEAGAASGELRGTLVDEDGVAVAGAVCELSRAGAPSVRASSAADGAFALPCAGAGTLRLSGADVLESSLAVPGAADLGRLVLQRRRLLTVRVESEEHDPIRGAAVQLMLYRPIDLGGEVEVHATTDAAGRTVLACPARAAGSLAVDAQGFRTQGRALAPDEREILLVLVRAPRLHGRVVDAEDRPVEGAEVSMYEDWSVRTDADGRFAIASLGLAYGRLIARKEGYGDGWLEWQNGAVPADPKIVLRESGALSGELDAPQGVRAIACTAPSGSRLWRREGRLDGASFRIADVPPGRPMRLLITTADGALSLGQPPLRPGETRDLGVLHVPAAAPLALWLRAPERVLHGVCVRWRWRPEEGDPDAPLADAGDLHVDLVDTDVPLALGAFAAGEIEIEALADGTSSFGFHASTGESAPREVSLELEQELAVEGVLLGNDACLGTATVSLIERRSAGSCGSASVRADGSFTVHHLQETTYDCFVQDWIAEGCDFPSGAVEEGIRVERGMGRLTIRLPSARRFVTGRVEGVRGVAPEILASLTVLGRDELGRTFQAPLGTDGRFRMGIADASLVRIQLSAVAAVAVSNPWIGGCFVEGRFDAGADVVLHAER